MHIAGSRITVTPEQAKSLSALQELLVISETEETAVNEAQVVDDEGPAEVDLESSDVVEEAEDVPKPRGRPGPKPKKPTAVQVQRQLSGKFVNVTDLIPPLPEKGTFKVENIKKSQYFFS